LPASIRREHGPRAANSSIRTRWRQLTLICRSGPNCASQTSPLGGPWSLGSMTAVRSCLDESSTFRTLLPRH